MELGKMASTEQLPPAKEPTRGLAMVSRHTWVYTNSNGFHTAVIIGSQYVLVVDTRATPGMSMGVIQSIRAVTLQPIRYMALTHYRSVREFPLEFTQEDTELASSCLSDFQDSSEIRTTAGETWVALTLKQTIELGRLKVQILQLHSNHEIGETIVWVPSDHTVVCGDLGHFERFGEITSLAAVPDCGALALEAITQIMPEVIVPVRVRSVCELL